MNFAYKHVDQSKNKQGYDKSTSLNGRNALLWMHNTWRASFVPCIIEKKNTNRMAWNRVIPLFCSRSLSHILSQFHANQRRKRRRRRGRGRRRRRCRRQPNGIINHKYTWVLHKTSPRNGTAYTSTQPNSIELPSSAQRNYIHSSQGWRRHVAGCISSSEQRAFDRLIWLYICVPCFAMTSFLLWHCCCCRRALQILSNVNHVVDVVSCVGYCGFKIDLMLSPWALFRSRSPVAVAVAFCMRFQFVRSCSRYSGVFSSVFAAVAVAVAVVIVVVVVATADVFICTASVAAVAPHWIESKQNHCIC